MMIFQQLPIISESDKSIELEFHHIIKCISNLIIWKELRHVKVSKVNYTYPIGNARLTLEILCIKHILIASCC